MAFFEVNFNEEFVRDGGSNSEYINKQGIYDVKIKNVIVKTNAHGARSLDFVFDYKGSENVIYGLTLDNNDGSSNFKQAIFNKLCIILGIKRVNDPVKSVIEVGKDRVKTEVLTLKDFANSNIKVGIKYIYSIYNAEIKEKREIFNFYRDTDGATASEIINKSSDLKQMEKDKVYLEKIILQDGLTEEDVKQWKEAKRKGVAAPVVNTTIKANNSFEDPFSDIF